MELNKVKNWYDNALKIYGIDSKSVGWKDRESQNLRFSKLLEVVSLECGGGGIY
ncbi:hypothetical protein [Helicobacter mesocricetorum]|uniref:hypothetical protein n=1 Tax=Helicobacter mesocricetorum TaxID=87012 RepID=UPI0013158FE6|nr:hypothetical protein [Helicobacter mesocricetorum]